jgi:hypothetical protein
MLYIIYTYAFKYLILYTTQYTIYYAIALLLGILPLLFGILQNSSKGCKTALFH